MSGMTVAPYPPIDGTQPCQEIDVEMFFPNPGESQRVGVVSQVIAICEPCRFRSDCLAYALTHDVSGIWGGTTGLDRRRLREQYGIHPLPVHDLDASQLGYLSYVRKVEEEGAPEREVVVKKYGRSPCDQGCGRDLTNAPGPRARHQRLCAGAA